MSPARREIFDVIDAWWRNYELPTPKRPLSRDEIRRRVSEAPPTMAIVRHMVRTIKK